MKADSKTVAPPAPVAAAAPKKKLLIVIAGAILALGLAGGGTAWFFMSGKKNTAEHKEVKKISTPVFVAIEPFTVNLQPENGEQYLQLSFSLQMENPQQVELIKQNMPKVRSRLLMLLSSKKSSELTTSEGKQQLAAEIIGQIKQPFATDGPQQEVMEVLFTSFIIQ
jgi:flagellar FliL protein